MTIPARTPRRGRAGSRCGGRDGIELFEYMCQGNNFFPESVFCVPQGHMDPTVASSVGATGSGDALDAVSSTGHRKPNSSARLPSEPPLAMIRRLRTASATAIMGVNMATGDAPGVVPRPTAVLERGHHRASVNLHLCFVSRVPGFAAPAIAQEGHPLKGSWIGTWGPSQNHSNDIIMIMNWDGKAITGTINPGTDEIVDQERDAQSRRLGRAPRGRRQGQVREDDHVRHRWQD